MTDPKRYARAHDVTRSMIEGRPMPEAEADVISTAELVEYADGGMWAHLAIHGAESAGDPQACSTCFDGGWVQVYSPRPPAFDVCPACHNPENHPCP